MSDEFLQMKNIGMAFSGVRVLSDVSFDVRAGEVHVLAGENGAGKSTLMRILSGVYDSYDGEILLDGTPVRFKSPRHAFDMGIGMIHQELSLVPPMNAVDNVFLGREVSSATGWLDRKTAMTKVRELFGGLGLDVDPARPIEDFPVSVRQMIEVAKVLSRNARIIIMDEPTSALSRPEVERLFEVITNLKKQGRGIVYITHKMEEIYRVADRITVLRDGRHAGTSPARELPQAELVRRMVGRDIGQYFPSRTFKGGEEALRASGLCVPDNTGRRNWAVNNVSFSVKAGEVLGLAGLEGAGNHEALRAVFDGTGRNAAGKVFVGGREMKRRNPTRSIRAGMAYLTNDRKGNGLVLNMSVTCNTTLAALRNFSPRIWIRRSEEAAATERRCRSMNTRCRSAGQAVLELSGGNQQKVALAKWLETRPRVLLLDEPTRGVDVGAKKDIYEMINSWTGEGIAVVLITSEMPELLALSDRIMVMHRGEIAAEFGRAEASQEKILAAAMGGYSG